MRLLQRSSRATTAKPNVASTDQGTQEDNQRDKEIDEEVNRGNQDEGFVSLEVEELQGGASLSVVCLVALDMVRLFVRHFPHCKRRFVTLPLAMDVD